MKKTLSILLAMAMLVSLSVPALAATTDTTNSGYVVVTEDFSAVTDHDKVSKKVNGGTDATAIGNTFYKNSRTNRIGDSDWVFKTTGEYNPGNADAYVSEDGALKINGGGVSFKTYPDRLITVYYDGDYSKLGDNFKITYNFSKSVNKGAAVKFMISEDVKSYYALNMETGSGSNLWNLYKVSDGVVTVLKSSNEKISTTTNKDGTGGTDAGTVTVLYDNGTISWDIAANIYGGSDMEYRNTGSYTDETPFTTAPSDCKIGFSGNSASGKDAFATFDNVKISYTVPYLTEDFSSLTASNVANTGAKQRTQITGTDFYVTSRQEPLNAKITANFDDATKVISGTSRGLKLQYNNASFFTHYQRMDFAEYRGDYSGLDDDYTISFEYYSNTARNSAYFYFGLPANADDNYTYDDYYIFMIDGLAEATYYNKAGVTTIPSWEIRKVEGGDTPSDVIVKSDNTFSFASEDATTLAGKGTGQAAITLTVKDGVATINVTGKIGTTTYTDTKTFNAGTMAGNHFAFSSGTETTAAFYDNIVVESNADSVEYKDGKVFINSGAFASRNGIVLFDFNDGTYSVENVTMQTHEKKIVDIPQNADRMFFWRDFETIRPLIESVDF